MYYLECSKDMPTVWSRKLCLGLLPTTSSGNIRAPLRVGAGVAGAEPHADGLPCLCCCCPGRLGVSASLQCHGELGNDKGASPGSAPHPLRRRIPRAVLFYPHLLQTWSVFQLLCLCVTPGGAGICSHVTMRPTGCKESGSCSDSPSRVPGGDRISLMFLQSPTVYLVFIRDGGGGRSGGSLGSELPLPSVFWGVGSIETCGV